MRFSSVTQLRFPSRAAETESTKQQIKLILLDLQTRPLIARREINDLVKNKGIKDAKGGGWRETTESSHKETPWPRENEISASFVEAYMLALTRFLPVVDNRIRTQMS